jgi:hypothetical protein
MDVIDEFYHTIEFQFAPKELVHILQEIKTYKEKEIAQMKEKIIKYEEKRRTHEAWYQSLPTFKKFFTGRPPSHHQAVEYLVNVKQRLSIIEEIKKNNMELEKIIDLLKNEPHLKEIILPHSLIDELKGRGGLIR